MVTVGIQPGGADVKFVDPLLTNMTLGFRNGTYFWDRVAPVVSVQQDSGTFAVYTSDYWFRRTEGMDRNEGGRYVRGGWGTQKSSYTTREIGIEKALEDSVQARSQLPESLELTDLAWLTNQMELELEIRVRDALFASGKWGKDTTGVLTVPGTTEFRRWDDFANSDPVKDMRAWRDRIHLVTGAEANTAFTSHKVMEALMDHPLLTAIYRRNTDGPLTVQDVSSALGVSLEIGRSVYDTGLEGVDDNVDTARASTYSNRKYVWGNHLLLQAQNTPQLGVANGAYTYIWDELGNIPWAVQLYREDQTRSDVRRIFTHPAPVIVSPHHGYFAEDVIAA